MKTKLTTLLTLTIGSFVAYGAGAEFMSVNWGDTLAVPHGHYRLTGDLSGSGTAITITADHVQLDLDGHTLTGGGKLGPGGSPLLTSTGIHVLGASHVQIKGGTITQFSYAIRMEAVADSQVKDCLITDNFRGIWLRNASVHNHIENNEVQIHLCCGIRLEGADDNQIVSNHSSANRFGVFVIGNANEVAQNTAEANGLWGVYVSGNDNEVNENTANANGQIGILVAQGTNNVVRENTANNNGTGTLQAGIMLGMPHQFTSGHLPQYATGTFVQQNTALGNASTDLFQVDVWDNSLWDKDECENTWQENVFVKDNETGADFGPGVGCIQ